MSNYIISITSTADLTEEYIKSHNLTAVLPYTYIMDETVYEDSPRALCP